MPCKIQITKEITNLVEKQTEPFMGLSLKSANKEVEKVNKFFRAKVVKFVMIGDIMDRIITIPESLVQIYYNNELKIEEKEAARLLKEEKEKERKYIESKKEEWEQNREYFENDEPFTRNSSSTKPNTIQGQQGSLFGLDNNNLEFHINTLGVVTNFLENIGIEPRLVSEFLSQEGTVVESAIAAANFIEGTVDIIDDLEKRPSAWNKLPEEAAHFWYRLLDTNSQLKDALLTSALTDRKEADLRNSLYGDTYKEGVKVIGKLALDSNSNITSKPALSPIREEAIGQLIAEAIKRIETENASASDYSFFKKFLEWINSVLDTFKNTTQDPFEVAAMKILSSDMSDLMTWEEYRKLNNIVNFADVLTEQSIAPIDYTLIEDKGIPDRKATPNNPNDIYTSYTSTYLLRESATSDKIVSPEFNTQEELDNWVNKTYGNLLIQRQKNKIQEVKDNQIFFDRLLNKSFRKKSKFLPKTLRKYFQIIDAQNLNPLREWNISQELQQITKKLTEEEKKQIVETNGYTNIAPTLKVLPDLLQKYKKNPIVLSEPIKIDGAKKQELSILSGIKEMIKLENPNLKSITAEEFVAEAHNWLETNYLLGFANEKNYLTYHVDQTFTHVKDRFSNEASPLATMTEEEINQLPLTERQRIANIVGLTKQNPDVYHNKVSIRFNDMSHLKSGHFNLLNGGSPSAWGNLTYFYSGKNKWKDAVLLHEIQNDNIEFLRDFKAEKVDLETSLGRYLQQLNTDLLDNITQIESGGKRIQKNYLTEKPRQHAQLNYQLQNLVSVPLEQGLDQLKQNLNEKIQLYKSDDSIRTNPEKAQEEIEKIYSQKRKFADFQRKGGIKSLLTKEELENLKEILKELNTGTIMTDAEFLPDENQYEPGYETIRDLRRKKEDFQKYSDILVKKINFKIKELYGKDELYSKDFPYISLSSPVKPRTKSQKRAGAPINESLNENVNFLLAFSELQLNKKFSTLIEEYKKIYIEARNATNKYNFNVSLSKITQEQYNNLIENYKYNQDLLNKLIDEQAQKDIQKESVDISKLSDEEILKDITGEFEEPNGIDGTAGSGFVYKNMYLSQNATTKEKAVLEIRDRFDPESQKNKQQFRADYYKKLALEKKEELDKNYGKIEDEVKQTLEIEMNYFTPLVHHLIQKHINQYGKDFPMYFSGYNITKLTQGNDRTAMIYAGKDEINTINKKKFEINGKTYTLQGENALFINNTLYKVGGSTKTTQEEYDKAKQDYEKAYQQATERRAKEIKFRAAKEIGLLNYSDFGFEMGYDYELQKLTDKQLEEGIKKLNEYKRQSKQNMDRVINTIMNISNNKPIETGAIYNAMTQISGVKLIWQDAVPGLRPSVTPQISTATGGYLVDLSNYNYNVPILYGLDLNKEKSNIKPGAEELFESNPELANAVYESLGFANTKTQIAQVKTSNKIITQYSDGTFDVIVDEEAYNKAKKEYNDNFEKRKNAIPQLIEDFKSGKRKDWGDDFLTEIIRNTFNGQFKYDKELNSFVTEEIEGDEENVEEGFKPAKFDKVTGKVGERLGFNKVAETEIFKQLTEANNKILKDDLGILDLWKSQEGIDRTKAEIQANYDLYEFDKYKQLNKEFVVPKNKGYVIRTVNGGLLNDLYGSSGIQTAIAYQENGTMPLKDSKGNYKFDAYMFIDKIDATGVYIRYTEVKSDLRGKGISKLLLNRVRELYPNLPIHRTMIHNPIIVKQSLKIEGVTDKKGNKLTGLKTDNDIKKWLESNDELIIPPLNNQITPQQKTQAKEVYQQYINSLLTGETISNQAGDLSKSQVKNVVYHFSNVKIDKLDKEKFSLSANINRRKGFFGINKNINPGNNFANVEGTIPHAMLFNMKNPDFGDFSIIPPVVAKDETKDSAIIKQRGGINYYTVFEPSQIHIMGSKSDIEQVKEFINNNNQKTKDYFSNEINKIQEESKIIENSLKEYETSKKIDNRNTTKAIKNKEEKTKETNNKLLSLGFEFINENEYQFSTSSYITFKSKLNSLDGINVLINTFKSPDYLIKIKIAPLKNNFDLQKQGELPFNPIELKLALKENDFIQDIADNTFEGLTEEQINILRDNLENGELNLNCKI